MLRSLLLRNGGYCSINKNISFMNKINNCFNYSVDKRSTDGKIFISKTDDPFLNLSMEEYLFEEEDLSNPVLYIWRNKPVVFIGRNQNPWKECNVQLIEEEKIPLVRRFSGGGAVYQDYGNLVWTFLSNIKDNFTKENNQILINSLGRLGLKAEASGRNDIILKTNDGDKKVSGCAFKIANNKIIHHGTMLLDVDVGKMQQLLNVNKKKLQSKGVESVKARVGNVVDFVDNPEDITFDKMSEIIQDEFRKTIKYGSSIKVEILDETKLKEHPKLKEKYNKLTNWDWRFGETPEFQHNLEERFSWGLMDVHFNSKDGMITDCQIFSDNLFPQMITDIKQVLKNIPYDQVSIKETLENLATKKKNYHGINDPQAQHILEFSEWLQNNI
eukprot:TRINITY_DN11016_c0_g1_i1.p1 TRINITY_DN11016_c0_g1~~TRINITY_DN11016_c0_g1_i1.p1  ORF type:complete len:386 (+),score=121.44 TRINITY_DN11016_c0_g1_i1:134-1291(+)